jgi:hypothetical protein
VKRAGRYLWLAFIVTILVIIVVIHLDEARSTFQQLLESFLHRSLAVRILIGFVVWLLSVIVPGSLFLVVIRPMAEENVGDDTGGFGYFLPFLVFWPPAWPVALILWLLLRR